METIAVCAFGAPIILVLFLIYDELKQIRDGLDRQARNPDGLPDRSNDHSFHRQVGMPHE